MKKIIKGTFYFTILVLTTLSFLNFSCKNKAQPSPPNVPNYDSSWWAINTNQFITYKTFVNGTSSAATMTGAADGSDFSMTFYVPYIPASGNYTLDCNNSASSACMQITYHNIHYRAKPGNGDYLQADSSDQRAIITLPPTWFYSTIQPNIDSVSINGVFMQPK